MQSLRHVKKTKPNYPRQADEAAYTKINLSSRFSDAEQRTVRDSVEKRRRSCLMLIAGDIGGTKTDLSICSTESGPHAPLVQTQVHSADYPSLQAMVADFLLQVKISVDSILMPPLDRDNPSDLCRATVDTMVSILASGAGNLALKVLTTGGIYLAGGLAMHLLGSAARAAIHAGIYKEGPL